MTAWQITAVGFIVLDVTTGALLLWAGNPVFTVICAAYALLWLHIYNVEAKRNETRRF